MTPKVWLLRKFLQGYRVNVFLKILIRQFSPILQIGVLDRVLFFVMPNCQLKGNGKITIMPVFSATSAIHRYIFPMLLLSLFVYVCLCVHVCGASIPIATSTCDPWPLRARRCPCRAPTAGKASGTAATRTTGVTGTASMVSPSTPSSPRPWAAPRGSRTNPVGWTHTLSLLRTDLKY